MSNLSYFYMHPSSDTVVKAFLLFALIAATRCDAAATAPAAGSFGFDWLQPATSMCAPITGKALKTFRSCEHSAEGSFGLRDPTFKCRRTERSEYLVYQSKAACLRNLETMKANAP